MANHIPSKDCFGYPPTSWLSPPNEIDFYINGRSNNKIACSLIYDESKRAKPTKAQGRRKDRNVIDLIDASTPIFIICHGHLSWRNQMLFIGLSKKLHEILGYPILRFDFNGNGHSDGEWKFAAYDENYSDICDVINYVHNTLQCRVGGVIAHSQGVITSMQYASRHGDIDCNDARYIPYYVNLAGRFHVPDIAQLEKRFPKEHYDELKRQGSVTLLKRGEKIYQLTLDDAKRHAEYDTLSSLQAFPNVKVLTIHGNADNRVPVEDAKKFDDVLKDRHSLKIIAGADHNFNGLKHVDEMASAIVSFIR